MTFTLFVRAASSTLAGIAAALAAGWLLSTPASATTINFNGLSGANGSPFTSYTESGFTVAPLSGSWLVGQNFGNPPPFIYFNNPPDSAAGITVTAAGARFRFGGIDLYSSTTPIPYNFTGLLNGNIVFTATGTVPNTFGNFATVPNPNATAVIDTLQVTLSNPASPNVPNPVGLDNIVVFPTPTTIPGTISCPGNGSLLSNINSTSAAAFVSVYTISTPSASPIGLSWTAAGGTPVSISITTAGAFTAAPRIGSAIHYQCSGTGSALYQIGTNNGFSFDCATAPTGTLFQELAGQSFNVLVEVTLSGKISMTYKDSTQTLSPRLSPNVQQNLLLSVRPGGTITYQCSDTASSGQISFDQGPLVVPPQ